MRESTRIANLLIMAIAISVPIVGTDQYLRFAKFPKDNARVMLLSGGRLDSSGSGIRRYTPNSYLRHSAVYGDVLEYSYGFKTDRNGFRVTYECNTGNEGSNLVAITGDSFTEGQGSNSSWAGRIQKRLCDQGYNSINASVAGYGVEGMKDSLDYAHKELGAKKAIVAIIPDDIYRPRRPMISNLTCSMYESRRCGDSATWWHHPEEFTPKELIAFANSKYDFGIYPVLTILKDKLKFKLKQLIDYRNNSSSSGSSGSSGRHEIIDKSISAMHSIASTYGAKNVSLIILPTKNDRELEGSSEVKARRSTDLREFLNSLHKDISVKDLRDCPLDARHFFRIDGHPNEKGHKQLGICASM
ncbi:hypothetical protein [Synechococcus sp. CBW1006]|uniref:hypothetical protein n=1 Tax=Synechococcus sp. CBW1006 TaxID=1353138 RepID=UPI0018CE3AE9|nr:hypothetical protein [Synechococcus sp. CBW1006]QPN65595.1 hypothetical protein H8F26_11675 [Synechococcus sp. CBW1006]